MIISRCRWLATEIFFSQSTQRMFSFPIARSIPLNNSFPYQVINRELLTIAGIFDNLDHLEYGWNGRVPWRGKNCGWKRWSRKYWARFEGGGEWKNRRKIHSLRWPGENKREKGNRGKEEASRGVVVSHPFSGRRVFTLSGGWVMRTVHAINLICRVEKLSELNPATMGRRRKQAVNSIRFRHTDPTPPPSVCLSTFLRGFNIPPIFELVKGVSRFRSSRRFDSTSPHRWRDKI